MTQSLTVAIPDGKPGVRVSVGLAPYLQDGHFGEIVGGPGGYTAWWSDARARALREWTTLDATGHATFTVLPGKTYQIYYAGDSTHGPQNLAAASPAGEPTAAVTLAKLAKAVTLTGKVVVKAGGTKGGMASLIANCVDDYTLGDEDPETSTTTCQATRTVMLDSSGRYTFKGLAPNTKNAYTVVATIPGYKQTWLGNEVGEAMWRYDAFTTPAHLSTKTKAITAQTITVKAKSSAVIGKLSKMGSTGRSVSASRSRTSRAPGKLAAIVGNRFIITGLTKGSIVLKGEGKGRCAVRIVKLAKNTVASVTLKGAPCEPPG
ncbi:MAG: hypothetical protein LBJ08_09695 [Bifidobacteriaceae bacterium]|nr:hypothetical protein [Bifidobacteriaceae bacterium]